ncbi:probable inactive dual specificity protein phosphatase-like At4g18593 isoform X1 [Magnolia sinica]|uniref:probable inactive dual specificity protein phosphatase-like At4g18593 isoform X1 n=2 Tax=Magnolia sinica TaxID=86752 RepID=UPI002659604E|nr:probable inactive dual specificity protein phosphatase-like At4g18593 isoform X1 [Magnolia sinica]XP_058100766.1 probable inactive dual specificity protein phosphatase-like At4g18593 isoform X1 [Magnolia sinica]
MYGIFFFQQTERIPTSFNLMEVNDIDAGTATKPQIVYRCKRCRRIVAAQENMVPHKQGEGERCFKWKKRGNSLETDRKPECSSIFVEPLKWMEAVQEGSVEEKLQCLGCKARLGSFNWAGMQCSCGTWVNPAFQLHKSRIDECCT